ncbi:MAG: EamA family transporter [Candidatus Omnitrophica bacterium]|nr:EamA family transporter [Candidatus Omnitrophota bacterium]MBU4589658.1 EamA family transporter [Candidatus Omnitrophota bacterium]
MKAFYFALATAVVWGAVPILEKMGVSRIAPLAGVLIRSFGVIIGLFILAIFNNDALRLAFKADPRTIFLLVVSGIMASIVGQIFFYNALKIGEVSKLVPIAGTYPLFAFLLGVIFLGEGFTLVKAGGVIFVVLGLFLLR